MVDHKAYDSREAFDAKLVEVIRASGAVLVCLAGFMRVVTPVFLRAFPHRILNIHPALLPSFPGTHGPAQALRYGVRFSGCTVHFLDEGVDTGPIVVQAVVPVHEDDTEETLAARILKEEHRIYPMAIRLFLEGRLSRRGEKGDDERRGKDPRLLPAQSRRLIPENFLSGHLTNGTEYFLSHPDKVFSSTSPAVNASMIPAASASVASKRCPFISRNAYMTIKPTLLLPSMNGWLRTIAAP